MRLQTPSVSISDPDPDPDPDPEVAIHTLCAVLLLHVLLKGARQRRCCDERLVLSPPLATGYVVAEGEELMVCIDTRLEVHGPDRSARERRVGLHRWRVPLLLVKQSLDMRQLLVEHLEYSIGLLPHGTLHGVAFCEECEGLQQFDTGFDRRDDVKRTGDGC